MDEGRPTRPAGVVSATLFYDGSIGRLVALWISREVLEEYLAGTALPRGLELMRKVGAEPSLTVVDVLEHG